MLIALLYGAAFIFFGFKGLGAVALVHVVLYLSRKDKDHTPKKEDSPRSYRMR